MLFEQFRGLMRHNVQKRKARPGRSIDTPGDDHELGLWINTDLIRKSCRQENHLVNPVTSTNNRYIELADILLRKSAKRS